MKFIKKIMANLKKIKLLLNEYKRISKLVIYKIIDQDVNQENVYLIQCVNSKAIFEAHVMEIIFNTDILYGLHPLQACFMGIEYTQYIKNNNLKDIAYLKKNNTTPALANHDNALLKLKHQDRKGNICFINTDTNQEEIMAPKDIAFSDKIIREFNSEQAFFIGICVGKKTNCNHQNIIYLDNCKLSKYKSTVNASKFDQGL